MDAGVKALDPSSDFNFAVVHSAGPDLLDHSMLSCLATKLTQGGRAEIYELSWLGDSPPATIGTSTRLLAMRGADALRKAAIFAGFTVASPTAITPLEEAMVSLAVATLYPGLAATADMGGEEARDALGALTTVLGPQLGLLRIDVTKPSFAKGTSFSLRSRAKVSCPK